MANKSITEHLNNQDSKVKKEFKRLYKFINNKNTFDWDKVVISNKEFNNIIRLVNKTILGEDISFKLGFKYFRKNKINVQKGVFVPQFDTEPIIDLLPKDGKDKTLIEIGTGTGVIAISAAKEFHYITSAIDVNKKAIKLSKRNALENEVEINIFNADVFKWVPEEPFDILISNPPYIDINDPNVDEWVKLNQPKNALYADLDGYAFYQRLILNHELYVKENGLMIFEIGFDQAKAIRLLAKQVGFESFKVIKDIEKNHDRFIVIKFN